jgi:hypothetical protein
MKKSFDLNNIRSPDPMRTKPVCYHRANVPYDVWVLIYSRLLKVDFKIMLFLCMETKVV